MPSVRYAAIAFASLAAACTNYDFAKARAPDGEYDMKRLIADLKASGEEELSAGIWIPLVWFDVTTFRASEPSLPAGYTLATARGYGPAFVVGSREQTAVDAAGEWIDTQEKDWIGWGLLYYSHDDWSMSTHGRRLRSAWRILLWGDDSIRYASAPR